MQTKQLTFNAEIKADEQGEGTFTGLASTFGNVDLTGDVIDRGAFKDSLKRRPAKKVKLLSQHNSFSHPLGVFEKIAETDKGLEVIGRLALGTQMGAEAFELMKMGALDALSIGFSIPSGGAEAGKRGVRRIKTIDLREISIVNFPANERARIQGVKELLEAGGLPTEREFEQLLTRDAGFSRSQALVILNRGFKALDMRDAEDGLHKLGGEFDRLTQIVNRM